MEGLLLNSIESTCPLCITGISRDRERWNNVKSLLFPLYIQCISLHTFSLDNHQTSVPTERVEITVKSLLFPSYTSYLVAHFFTRYFIYLRTIRNGKLPISLESLNFSTRYLYYTRSNYVPSLRWPRKIYRFSRVLIRIQRKFVFSQRKKKQNGRSRNCRWSKERCSSGGADLAWRTIFVRVPRRRKGER